MKIHPSCCGMKTYFPFLSLFKHKELLTWFHTVDVMPLQFHPYLGDMFWQLIYACQSSNPFVGLFLLLSLTLYQYITDISPAEVSKFAVNFCTTCSCVIKIVEPRACATIEDLKASVLKVNALEEEKKISPWDDEHVPEEIVIDKPNPGSALLVAL